MVIALELLSDAKSVFLSNNWGSQNRYLEESRTERCLHRGKFYSGVFTKHTAINISIAASSREDVASVRSQLVVIFIPLSSPAASAQPDSAHPSRRFNP